MILASLMALSMAQSAASGMTPSPKTPVAWPQLSPALDPWAVQFDLTSQLTGRTYRIYVSRPAGPAPKGGWPVVYVLDGDFLFSTVASQNVLRSKFGETSAVVVGIGYPDAASAISLRNRDLTPSEPNERCRETNLLGKPRPDDYGGADKFHRFMIEEVRPRIEAAFPVNVGEQTLMGYSYGGLFTLNVMFNHPSDYSTYVISSPSIWWNDREVLRGEDEFLEEVRTGRVAPRILVTSDGWEQDPKMNKLPADTTARKAVVALMEKERMVDNARELATRLAAVPGKAGYRVRYVLFPEETHLTGMPVASSRGYAFALTPW